MKLFYLIFVIFCMTQLTTAWRHRPRHKRTNNTNVALGHFNQSQINMSNGGYGNVQANAVKVFSGYHR